MTVASGFSVNYYVFYTSTGAPNAAGSIYVYQTGTTTPLTLYADGGLITPISNPIILDANGGCTFYYNGAVNMKIVSYSATGGLIQTIDPCYPVGGAGTLPGNNTITSAMLAQQNGYTFLGNPTNSLANVIAMTATQVLTTLGTPIAPIANAISANIGLTSTGTYFDGPSVAQGSSGTWLALGTLTMNDTAGGARFNVKLWDGTTVIASTSVLEPNSGNIVTASLHGFITNPAGNLRLSAEDISSSSGLMLYNESGLVKDCNITAIRIG